MQRYVVFECKTLQGMLDWLPVTKVEFVIRINFHDYFVKVVRS